MSSGPTRRQRQAIVLLIENGPLSPAGLKDAAARRWGQGAWKFGKALRELRQAQWVTQAGEVFTVTRAGCVGVGQDPDA